MAVEYLRLASASDDEFELEDVKRTNGRDRLLIGSLVVALVSSILSLLLYSFPRIPALAVSSSPPQSTLRANSYLHFDRFLPNITAAAPVLHNFPPISLHLRTDDPARTTWEDDRGHDSIYGWVYPDDRRVIVNDTTSTALQFRNRDFGLTRCVLRLAPPVSFKDFHSAAIIAPGLQNVDVWLLEPSSEWSPNGDVWAHAPARAQLLTRLALDLNGQGGASEEFECKQGGWTAIELSCAESAGGHCAIDFWQKEGPILGGVYLEQTTALDQ